MSATISSTIFKNYFSDFKYKHISIPGRTYGVSSIFLKSPIKHNQFLDEGLKIIIQILKSDKPGDILFFITSKTEAFRLCKNLTRHLESTEGKQIKTTFRQHPFCVELFSGIDPKKQELAQEKDLYKAENNYNRKIVVSTNVAESSLTVDGIKFVIDSGLELNSIYDPIYHAKILQIKLISQAQAIQRKGRSGRTSEGTCYHLYTKDDFENIMEKFPQPDIRVSDLSVESLRFLNKDSMDVKKLIDMFTRFIEPPRENYIVSSINTLMQLGVVENNKISKLGKKVIKVGGNTPMDGLALIFSKIYNCSYEMSKIISLIDAININIDTLFYIPRRRIDKQEYMKELEKFNKIRRKFKHKYGDHLSLLNIYTKFENFRKKYDTNKLQKWCRDNYLKYNILQKAIRYYHKTRRQIRNIDISDIETDRREDIIKLQIDDRILASLLIAYRTHTAVTSSSTQRRYYKTIYSKDLSKIQLSKHSFLTLTKILPKNVFYNELVISRGRPSLNIVSTIPKILIKLMS